MANFTINQAKVHGVAISRAMANLHAEADRLCDPALTATVDAMHAHLAAARQTLASGFGVPVTTIAPDGGVKPPSAS